MQDSRRSAIKGRAIGIGVLGWHTLLQEKSLPFEPLVPNAKTISAMREARDRQLKSFGSTKALMKDLNAKN